MTTTPYYLRGRTQRYGDALLLMATSIRALTSKSDNINAVNMVRLLIAELDAVL